jgi:hypothetical protein
LEEDVMTDNGFRTWRRSAALAAVVLGATASGALAQGKPEVYNATASLKTAAGAAVTAPVVISIDRWTTDGEREKVVAALKAGGTAAVQKQVAAMPAAGTLQVGNVKTPIHFARTLPVGGGKVVTVATSQPVLFVGAGAPGAKPKAGYDVAMAIFEVDAAGKGEAGDFAPAAKVKLDERGAFVIEDSGTEAVRLVGITRK